MSSLIPNTMSLDDHVKKIYQAKYKVQSGIFEMAEAITNAINQLQGRQLELATRLNMSKGTISKWISIGSNKSLMTMQEKAPSSFNSLYQLSSLDNQFNKHYGKEEGTKKFIELFKNNQITAFSQRNDINKIVKLYQGSLKKAKKIQNDNSKSLQKKNINTILNSEIKLRVLVKSKLTFNTIIVVPSENQLDRWYSFDRETLINEDYPIKSLENLNKEIFQQCFIKVKAKKLDVAISCLRAWGFFYNNILIPKQPKTGLVSINEEQVVIKGFKGLQQNLSESINSNHNDDLVLYAEKVGIKPFLFVGDVITTKNWVYCVN